MPEPIEKGKILEVLADRLPEDLLLDLFPDHSPADIRDLLRNTRNPPLVNSEGQPAGRVPAQGTLPFPRGKTLTCSLYTDGASRGNPGEAGAGIVMYDDQGRELLSRSLYLGKRTNNAAEYLALIAGLESAVASGCQVLNIHLDSELIVRQIQGAYKVKNEQLKPLYVRVQKLLSGIKTWRIRHVPREQNSRADELANRGIDEAV